MIRMVGILTGSAIAVAFLIVALGVPEFAAPEPPQPTTPDNIEPIEHVVYEALPQVEVETEAAAAAAAMTIAEAEPMPLETALEPPAPAEPVQEMADQQWYAFWSPFRSEIAADGFVSQLQRTTGLDYRVVKIKPGVYEVAFAYSNDSDIQDKLTQISSATGLDLSGG